MIAGHDARPGSRGHRADTVTRTQRRGEGHLILPAPVPLCRREPDSLSQKLSGSAAPAEPSLLLSRHDQYPCRSGSVSFVVSFACVPQCPAHTTEDTYPRSRACPSEAGPYPADLERVLATSSAPGPPGGSRTAVEYSNAIGCERPRRTPTSRRPAPTTPNDLGTGSSHRGGQGFKSPQLHAGHGRFRS